MKNFRNLTYLLIAVMFIFFTGCEKNDTTPEISIASKYAAQEKLMQNGISAYNAIGLQESLNDEVVNSRDGDGIFEEEFGTATESRVVYQYDDKELYMMPLQKDGMVENFMIVDDSDEILLLNKTDLLTVEDITTTGVSENLVKLFEISDELISDINANSVDDKLNSDYNISRNDNLLIANENASIANAGLSSGISNIFYFSYVYLNKSSNMYSQLWGLSTEESGLFNSSLHQCSYGNNPFVNSMTQITDVTDFACVVTTIGEWPGLPMMNACPLAAGLPTLINYAVNQLGYDQPLTPDEITLINTHCTCGFIVMKNAIKALSLSGHLFPTPITRNNCRDAYRHTYWNALNASSLLCIGVAADFAAAHEQGQPNNNNLLMDEWNNAEGQLIGAANPTTTAIAISTIVLDHLAAGSGIILQQTPICPNGAACDTNPLIPSFSCTP